MLTIACVYRSGGDFTHYDVTMLAESINRNVTMNRRIVCLTDHPYEVFPYVDEVIPLKHNWPGWWSKMELFDLPGPVLYFDLDTRIIRPIDDLCRWALKPTGAVLMLRDFYHPERHASGIMAWNHDLSWLTRQFADLAEHASWEELAHGVRCNGYRGDQEYIREQLYQSRIPIEDVQDTQLGIYSYKVDVQPTNAIPVDASILCFHGRPRPSEVTMPELPGAKALSIPESSE